MSKEANVLKKRGSATINLETGDVDFRAYNEGTSAMQKNVVKKGDAKLFETEGEKVSSICVHLKVSRDAADPRAELYDQLDELLAKKRMDGAPEGMLKAPVRCLEKTDVLKIWHNRKTKKVIVQMAIDTEINVDLSKPLYQLTSLTNKCLVINKASISPRRK